MVLTNWLISIHKTMPVWQAFNRGVWPAGRTKAKVLVCQRKMFDEFGESAVQAVSWALVMGFDYPAGEDI